LVGPQNGGDPKNAAFHKTTENLRNVGLWAKIISCPHKHIIWLSKQVYSDTPNATLIVLIGQTDRGVC